MSTCRPKTPETHAKQEGSALLLSMVFLALFSLLGLSALRTSSNELLMAGNLKNQSLAFYNAEAGIQYALLKMEQGLRDRTFELPETEGDSRRLPVEFVPESFDFHPCTGGVTKADENVYSFACAGTGPRNAHRRIRAAFRRGWEPAIRFAVFANTEVILGESAGTYSYNSSRTKRPNRYDAEALTGKGDIGSNEAITLEHNTVVDGSVHLGTNEEGVQASLWLHDTAQPGVSGETDITAGRMDPDPLNLTSGIYASGFNAPFRDFDNDRDGLGSILEVAGTCTLTARGSGTDYYFNHIRLEAGSMLMIDVRAAPLTIYLTGPMRCGPESTIGVIGDPTDFTLLCNAHDSILLGAGSTFTGLLYAPSASIEIAENATLYGAVWADRTVVGSGASVYYDERLGERYLLPSADLFLVNWDAAFP